MLQSHPIEEPHLDFSSWRESFNNTTTTTTNNNNNNNNDRGNGTSARCELGKRNKSSLVLFSHLKRNTDLKIINRSTCFMDSNV